MDRIWGLNRWEWGLRGVEEFSFALAGFEIDIRYPSRNVE